MVKIAFVSSDKPEAKKSLEILNKIYETVKPNKADIIVALGGDGTVLKSLHNFLKSRKPIYGMNRGNVGFLMINILKKIYIKDYLRLYHINFFH